MALSPDYRTAVIAGPVWLGILLVAYEVKRRRMRARVEVETVQERAD